MIFIWLFLLERAQIVHDIVCADGDCDDTLRQAVSTVGLITCFRTGSTTSPETAVAVLLLFPGLQLVLFRPSLQPAKSPSSSSVG